MVLIYILCSELIFNFTSRIFLDLILLSRLISISALAPMVILPSLLRYLTVFISLVVKPDKTHFFPLEGASILGLPDRIWPLYERPSRPALT